MNQQRDLEGISALVTGASSGIGRAAAEELGRHGAEVIVHGRDVARGSAVADTITAEGGKARFVAADLTDPNQLDGLVDQAGVGATRGVPDVSADASGHVNLGIVLRNGSWSMISNGGGTSASAPI